MTPPVEQNSRIVPFRMVFSGARRYLPQLVVAVVLLGGCTRETRHEVLTFFFTGVPPLESPAETVPQPQGTGGGKTPPPAERGSRFTVESKQQTSSKPPVKPQYYSHRVWLEGQCDACHQGSKLFLFQTPAATGTAQSERVFFAGGGMPGPLKSSADKLCSGCHVDKTGLRAIRDQLWLHNPTAKGDCLACHDPHQSKHSGVLRKPAEQICQPCHTDAALAALPTHRYNDRPCLACHNPHMGKDRNLLSKDYQEEKQLVVSKPQGSQ